MKCHIDRGNWNSGNLLNEFTNPKLITGNRVKRSFSLFVYVAEKRMLGFEVREKSHGTQSPHVRKTSITAKTFICNQSSFPYLPVPHSPR